MNQGNLKVLLGSPVRQKAEILRSFLLSIKELRRGELLSIDCFFVDDNVEEESSQLLVRFAEENPDTILM
ncbi:MAG: glycosyl transferase, partial [Syntrophothermaceae bacterium]